MHIREGRGVGQSPTGKTVRFGLLGGPHAKPQSLFCMTPSNTKNHPFLLVLIAIVRCYESRETRSGV
jgi:hypothetical protein